MSELDWEDKPHKAYMALRTVLHALRDRLTVEEAIQLGAQLPMLIRGFYYEGWNLKGKPHKERHKEDFLDHIKKAFKDDVTVILIKCAGLSSGYSLSIPAKGKSKT